MALACENVQALRLVTLRWFGAYQKGLASQRVTWQHGQRPLRGHRDCRGYRCEGEWQAGDPFGPQPGPVHPTHKGKTVPRCCKNSLIWACLEAVGRNCTPQRCGCPPIRHCVGSISRPAHFTQLREAHAGACLVCTPIACTCARSITDSASVAPSGI